ncbi:MAG: hypothetical protein N2116_04880 [Armatimonadetes bacterium]|nr:hypothetical protein [Armatimonadota bacterium]
MRQGKAVASFLGLIFVAAAVVFGVIAFMNSPHQVAQKWADALAQRNSEMMKKLVLPKDQERVSGLLNVANMLPDMSAQLAGIEDQQGQKIARISVKFSRVVVGNFNLNLSGNVNLPFVLVRDRLILWRVDLEKSEPLIREEARKAFVEALKRNPALQSLLKLLPR